jgi:hypothetical protein
MKVEPHPEHRWLEQFVGEWTYEHECAPGPDQPHSKLTGVETVRTLGGVWILCEGQGEMPDGCGAGLTVMTLGYDPARKRFVGSFIGSMMTFQWLYDGTLNGNVLTLDSEGPSFAGDGTMAKYQDIIEILSPDHRILRSQTLGGDGKWQPFMTAHYRRKQ